MVKKMLGTSCAGFSEDGITPIGQNISRQFCPLIEPHHVSSHDRE